MSIVSPKDMIVVEIDGLTGRVEMKLSRTLPGLYVLQVLTQLCANLAGAALQQEMQKIVLTGKDNDGTATKKES